ncbi:gliding motility-associated C-terminal domain-containing protein [uncultured Capnocytophaga sp.]|uniref:T9SS type B sorting domain-containing protein n=1 Tax=uncultured Capnocytophaga sp. TaxID=159273 RepID=UPI00259617AD|nr:gliding motility-associated C-terminal domain-containing protein [uncultured Capnocytophaga sp.]
MKRNLLTVILLIISTLGAVEYAEGQTLRGFAGVTKLIGCGSGPNANKAEVSITNVTGATAYDYSFDGGINWQSSNKGWLPQGTYPNKIQVRDRNNPSQVYKMSVTIPAPPSVIPIITKEFLYDCDGRPTLKVGIQNPQPSYRYYFKLDNAGAFSSNYIFQNVSTGTHTITVKYEDTTVPSPSMLLREDFGVGPENMYLTQVTQGASTTYQKAFDTPDACGYVPNVNNIIDRYYVTNGRKVIEALCWGNYATPPFYTTPLHGTPPAGGVPRDPSNSDPQARYFMIDLNATGEVFRKSIKDIDGSKKIEVRVKFYNLIAKNTGAILPTLRIKLLNGGTEVFTTSQFVVPEGRTWDTYSFTAPANGYTNLDFVIYSDISGSGGNDLAMDDIEVFQLPDNCGVEVSDTVTATTLQMPTISANLSNCSPSNNTLSLVVTPTSSLFTYQYQMDGGALQNSNVFTSLAMGTTHTFKVHYKPVASVVTLVNEDFGVGTNAVANSYVNPEYFFESMNGANIIYNGNGVLRDNSAHIDKTVDGEYAISTHITATIPNIWYTPVDASGTVNGRMLLVDLDTSKRDFYMREVSVFPNKRVNFSAAFFNLIMSTAVFPCNTSGPHTARVRFYPNKAAYIANQTPIKEQSILLPNSVSTTDWKRLTLSLSDTEVGANTSLYFVLDLPGLGGCNDIAVDDIVITQALAECTKDFTTTIQTSVNSAFAGVTKLIGCGTGANANNAEVTIANVEGGSGNYEYSFDGITWTASNTGWLPAGTRTISVRDAATHGCPFEMSVNVPAALATPVIKTEVFYGCDGKPTLQVGVQSPVNELTYLYKLDSGAFTTTSVFANVSSGTHQVNVKYEYRDTPSPMVLWREDFGTGDPAPNSSVNATDFTYKDPRVDNLWAVGRYTVAGYKDLIAPTPFGTSRMPFYHPTTAPNAVFREPPKGTTTGAPDDRILYVDMAAAYVGKVFMEKEVDIHPTNLIVFSYQIQNANGPNRGLKEPNMQIKIVDANNASNVLGTINSGAIANDGVWHLVSSRDLGAINPNGVTRVKIQFINVEPNSWGNDFYLDDITIYQTPATCGQVVSITQNITDNPVGVASFTAAQLGCGGTDGTVVITASPTTGYIYTYTLQGGTATSVNTFRNLSFGTHTFTINYAPVTNTLVLLNEDFGEGTDAVKSPYVGKNLYFNENTLSAYTAYNANKQSINHLANTGLMVGEYTIASNMVIRSYDWTVPADRSGKANGRKLFIDGIVSVPEQEVYTREVSIAPNLPLTFTTDFYNLVHNASVPSANNPRVNIALYESEASYKNGSVPLAQSPIEELLSVGNQWKTHTLTLTAGDVGTRTRIYAVVKMHSVINHGHDLTIDNIRITQSIGCKATVTATVLPGVTRAFAGVTQLIGCGTEENADKAQVRVSNVEGGTTPYEYQFGTGAAWVTTNTMWLEAGTYTVSVRSNGGVGCVFSTKVVVPARLATPTLSMDVQYDCEGKGILTLGVVDADPNLQYWFSLNSSAYTTTYMFTGLTSGTHLVSVKYDYITSPQPVLLFKDDFGNGGPTALPGPASDYGLTYGTTYPIGAGFYQIVSQAQAPSYWKLVTPFNTCAIRTGDPLYDRWVSVYDHTSGGTDGTGRFYMSDFRGTQADGDLFYKREVSVLPGSDINYEFYALNLFRNDHTTSPWGHGEALKPNVVVRLVAPNGTVVASTTTGEIPNSVCATNLADNLNNWRKYEGKLNVGTYTKLTVEIRSVGSAPHGWGNDMALDDITVLMTPKSCGQYHNVDTDVIATDRVVPQFTVSRTIDCATGKGGFVVTPTLTTGYTYTYTLNSTTVTGTIATFTGLSFSDTTHTITVQYQSVSKTVTVLKEDFGVGKTPTEAVKSPYIGEDWYFNKNTTESYSTSNGKGQNKVHPANKYLDNQEYTIASEFILNSNSNDWMKPVDKSGNANGRKLFVDGHTILTAEANLYLREIGVLPNQPLTFTTDFFNVISLAKTAVANTPSVQPQVRLQLYESERAFKDGNPPLKQTNIYHVPAGTTTTVADWKTQTLTLSSTEVGSRTKMFAVIKMYNLQHNGHDLAVDNIIVTQELPACVVTFTATLTNEGLRTPTLSVPANIDILCTSATATTAVANWIAQATATDTNCDVAATVTATYTYTGSLCNAGSVTVTFTATGTFGNITTKTAVINFIKTPLVVTPTVLQVPDNTTGGTTSSVIPNITLGGVTSPSVNSVTITFSGLPSGVTSTTGGRLVVAPNTPAGVHSISYMVCEVANSNNCKTVTSTLIIGAATPTVGANTFTATTNTRTVIPGVIGNILTGATVGTRTATAGVGGNVSITLTHTPTTPNAPQIDPATGSVTVSSNTPAGVYTIGYQLCSSPIHCQAAVATITVPQIKPYIPAATITHSGTVTTTHSIFVGGHVNGGTQSPTAGTGGSVSIGNIVNPTPATPGASVPYLTPNTGVITVPPTTPNGVYTISYQVCTTATPTSCVTGTTTITVANVTPTVTADNFTANTNTRTTVPGVIGNVLTNDRVGTRSATAGTGGNVTINITHTPRTPNAPVLNPATGSVTVSGNTPAGVYTIGYEVCNGTKCATGTVTVTVPQLLPNVPTVSITHSGTATTTRNVLDGGTVNGGSQSATVTGSNPTVQITVTSTPTGSVVPRLDPSTGIVTVPPTTPNGVYTISYNICTTATPTSCVSRTTVITVGNSSATTTTPTIVITPDSFVVSSTSTRTTPSVFDNDRIVDANGNTHSVTSSTVTISTQTVTTNASGNTVTPTINPDGTITIPEGLRPGNYTITYQLCTTASPSTCTTGEVNFEVPDNEVPDAHTITATTFINTPVEIKVTDKPATHVNVITPPANGIATNNGDGTITYEPNNGFVGTDEFEYTLCTAGGCSTATVRITVTADLIIYNGVSLNGSALNNHFHIGGIEAYPNNTVRIYNRWGAEVFSAEGYDNLTKVFNGRSNARATMDAGDHLPQGTYYYIIEYYDAASERHKEVGWLYLKK